MTGKKQKLSKRALRQNVLAWALLSPTLLFVALFTFYPFVKTIYLSFFRKNLTSPQEVFIGLENYISSFQDPVFQKVLGNNAKFSLIVVPSCIILGLGLACLLNTRHRGVSLARAAVFYPNISSMIGFSLIWMFLLTPNIGFVSNVMQLFHLPPVNFLGDPNYVLYSLMFVYIWREAGFVMIFFLSGMQGISQEYYEAATIDGAGSWTKFFRITLPLLMPTMVFVLTFTIINSVKMVDSIIVMTNGGPDNASSLLMFHIYKTAFSFWDQGSAAALSVIMLVVVLAVTLLEYYVTDKLTYYES